MPNRIIFLASFVKVQTIFLSVLHTELGFLFLTSGLHKLANVRSVNLSVRHNFLSIRQKVKKGSGRGRPIQRPKSQ